jgi:hypothetical protein
MVFSPQHGKRELYFILTMFVSRAVKRIINSMGPLVGFFDSPRVNGDAYFCFLWINFLIELDDIPPAVAKIYSVVCLIEHLMKHNALCYM